jgi:hypothetical protein
VLDGMERPVKQRAHLVMFVAYELSEELPALRRVGVVEGEGAADAFDFGDLGELGAGGECLGDSGEASFAAEIG